MTALADRSQQVRAVSAVMRRLPEGAWRDNPAAGTNGVLDALFGPSPKRQRPKKPFVSRVYNYPVPVGPAGAEYRARVRAWGRAQGHAVLRGGPLEGWLLNAYVEATGDIWDPSAPPGPKPGRQLKPCGTASALHRHYARGETTDEACRAAARDDNRDRAARYRANKKKAVPA